MVRPTLRHALAFALAASLTAAAPTVMAEEADELPDPLVDSRSTRTWQEGTPRPFVSSTIDVGYLYLRPRVALGYGLPHASWLGIEANPIFANNGLGAYGGIRGALPFVDLRVGARGFYAFEHSYLAPATSYRRLDLETTNGGHSQVITYESELTGQVVVGPGEIGALASISALTGVPSDSYVLEETLHVIVKAPILWRARAGYSFFLFPSVGRISAGPVVEVLGVPGRDAIIVRSGIIARVALSRNLEVRGTFVPAVASPDAIGLQGGDFTELGLRYRWATGR